LKLLTPFMLDPQAQGGLGLKTQDVGLAYGTVGVISLTLGGLLGGWAISQYGLKRMLWPMVLAMHVPNLLFVVLAALQPSSLWWVSTAVAAEQAGYGFGFAAYLVFMLMLAGGLDGQATHKTAHYALCTGFMALGMMLPGMWAGWLQAQLGYLNFFIVVCLATVPSFIATSRLRIDANFGRKPSE
jgi:MFS transporter, PAT family, beta-lactamase induction signal transducer AmpG